MGVERWWKDTEGEKPTYCEKILSQWHLVHRKSHTDWHRIEPGICGERPAIILWGTAGPMNWTTSGMLYILLTMCPNKICPQFKHQTSPTQTKNSRIHRYGIGSECDRKQLPAVSSLKRTSLAFQLNSQTLRLDFSPVNRALNQTKPARRYYILVEFHHNWITDIKSQYVLGAVLKALFISPFLFRYIPSIACHLNSFFLKWLQLDVPTHFLLLCKYTTRPMIISLR